MRYRYEVVYERNEVTDNSEDHYVENKITEGKRGMVQDASGAVVAHAILDQYKNLGNVVRLTLERIE